MSILCTEKISLKKQESKMLRQHGKNLKKNCQKIADQGEIPVIVGGSDAWQLMRYLSFSPWRVTGSEFIQGYQAGTDSFSDNESAKYAVNLLSDLGTKGYFEPGFASVDFTSACNLFFGGSGAIFYTGSGQISLAEEMYDNGELGFFPVPDTEGMDNMSTNIPVHAGFAEDLIRQHMMIQCRNSLIICAKTLQMHATIRHRFSHRLMKNFRKDCHSFTMIHSQCLKMQKQHGLPGMTNWIQM